MPDTIQVRVADELALAEQAAAGPRQRVTELQAELRAAIATGRFDDAHRVQQELGVAQEEAAVTDAHVTALRGAAARVEHERAVQDREIAEAQQRQGAEQDLAAAREAEQEGRTAAGEAIQAMWDAVASAQRFLRAAQSADAAITTARAAQIQARRRRGDWPADHPGPAPNRSNIAGILVERDKLVSVLSSWSPPR